MSRRLRQRKANLHAPRRGGMKYIILGICIIGFLALPIWALQNSISKVEYITKPPAEVYSNLKTVLEPSQDRISPDPAALGLYKVTRIIDGDTIEIQIPNYGVDRIRIKGIDTPEIRKAACKRERELALEATRLAEKYLTNQSVALKADPKRDQYGRTVAAVTLPDGRDFGTLMMNSGLAAQWPQEIDWCKYR